MIAELYGKVSSTNSNLTERLEDELTGNFFGNMRYLSFNKWMKPILVNCVKCNNLSELINRINAEEWDENIYFWKWDKESEIDIVMLFDETIVGIEVKYMTPPDFDCNVDSGTNILDIENTQQQFIRESRTLVNIGGNRTKLLILLADEATSRHIDANNVEKSLQTGVMFAHITWQDVLLELEKLRCYYNPVSYESVIVDDLMNLLKKKGFDRFNDFEIEKPLNIEQATVWMFDYKVKNGFDFKVNIRIIRGLHYGFS